MLLVKRHGFAVRHVTRAGLQCLSLWMHAQPSSKYSRFSRSFLLLDIHKYPRWADAKVDVYPV
ncbi:hypothetical protein ALO48_200008 [Pseudomonas syringae pv. rhaphiolepidis]|nr:hypothetical protein ALO48_200008 [Pseudomonas syringae pv. rhaphiolepidis]